MVRDDDFFQENIEGGSSDGEAIDDMNLEHEFGSESESDADETAQEKRIRLAKKYIASVKSTAKLDDLSFDAADVDRDIIASRLHEDVMESKGQLTRALASRIRVLHEGVRRFKGHRLSVTCALLSIDDSTLYSGSKCGVLLKTDIKSGKRQVLAKEKVPIRCLALSSDGRFLAVGVKDVQIWDTTEVKMLHTFKQHRDFITALAFRRGTNMLYSASADRTVKVFNVEDLAYMETLFGHQETITSLDTITTRERCLSTGGRDRTARLWKIPEESQLVFRASAKKRLQDETGSLDCCVMLDENQFVTGSDGGALALWSMQKKKPVSTMANAHGRVRYSQDDEISSANWISALASVPYSDVVASGSCDGKIRMWKILSSHQEQLSDDSDMEESEEKQTLKTLFKQMDSIEVKGFVNGLFFSQSGKFLIAAIGQEHKWGRWQRVREARNGVLLIPLQSQ